MKTNIKNVEFVNLAKSGSTINYIAEQADTITQIENDVTVVMYGSVDARIRPDTEKNRFYLWSLTPKHYRSPGMMDPRPFYSKNKIKKAMPIVDNFIRSIICHLMFLTQGKCQWCPKEQFAEKYIVTLTKMRQNISNIVLITPVYIDERIYGKENVIQYAEYTNIVKNIAEK
mgnify:CR=1 FL=1